MLGEWYQKTHKTEDTNKVNLFVSSVLCVFWWISTHHVTRHNTPIQNILSIAPQLSISQKVLGMLPEDGNVMPKHVGHTIHNK
jgi:hypothetical protein